MSSDDNDYLTNYNLMNIPHRGSLCRIHMNIDNSDTSTSYNQPTSFIYAINILSEFAAADSNNDNINGNGNGNGGDDNDNDDDDCTIHHDNNNNSNNTKCKYQLQFHPEHYKFMNNVFAILDTESRGYITKQELEDFVLLRCPVFKRRDKNLKVFQTSGSDSGNSNDNDDNDNDDNDNKKKKGFCSEESEEEKGNETLCNDGKNDEMNAGLNTSLNDDNEHGNDNDYTINDENADEKQQIQDAMHDYQPMLERQNEQDIFNFLLGGTDTGAGVNIGVGADDFQSANDQDHEHDLFYDEDDDNNNNNDRVDIGNDGNRGNDGNGDNDGNNYIHNYDHQKETERNNENIYNAANVTDNESSHDVLGENNDIHTRIHQPKQSPKCEFDPSVQSQTFEEVWDSVVQCSCLNEEKDKSKDQNINSNTCTSTNASLYIGIEGWMVFCRFISLAQYQDAKRRFSARHLQQAVPQKSTGISGGSRSNSFSELNSSGSNEVILVDVPPPELPMPISAQHLIEYELMCLKSEVNSDVIGNVGIALPELDLDHSHLLLHDNPQRQSTSKQIVEITVFRHNTPTSSSSPSDNLQFVIRLAPNNNTNTNNTYEGTDQRHIDHQSNLRNTSSKENIIVRRSFSDLSWLHDTFKAQKQLGGTLCGRILPPFPSPLGSSKSSSYDEEKNLTSSTAISVASASAVMVTSAAKSAKSFLGRLSISSSSPLKGTTTSSKKTSTSSDKNVPVAPIRHGSAKRKKYALMKDSIMDNPASKSKQLERYMNYMLDHPAMSTSFPLNVVLKASQSGVDSAKSILENHTKSSDINNLMNGGSAAETRYNFEKYGIPGNLSWVRTAAQAALALKLHGILETTGYQSVSAKLQHASLPKFSKIGTFSIGDDETAHKEHHQMKQEVGDSEDDFEKGIVCVESNLDEQRHYEDNGHGYDMLPSPLPLPERSALCAGSVLPKALTPDDTSLHQFDSTVPRDSNHTRGRYSDVSADNDAGTMLLGDVSVDRDIERLRDMIRTVDLSLGRCLASGICIGAESSEKASLQLDLLKEIDAGEGWRGKIISERALLSGVESLEKTREASITSTESFVTDISWNASFASSAVAAADEVRDAVKASRTASRAKNAAEIAAGNADQACQTTTFSNQDEARNAQVRASKLRSQAIHAAVVEYEAVTAKRQAAVALARDVKCWNVHRKQQLKRTCLEVVKSHQKLARDSISAWESLRDGLLESSSISSIVHSSVQPLENRKSSTITDVQVPTSPNSDIDNFSFHEDIEILSSSQISYAESSPKETIHPMQLPQPFKIESSFDQDMDFVPTPNIQGDIDETLKGVLSSQTPDVESSFHDTFEVNIPVENGLVTNVNNVEPESCLDSLITSESADQVVEPEEVLSATTIATDMPSVQENMIDEAEAGSNTGNDSDDIPPYNETVQNDSHLIANEGSALYDQIATAEVGSENGMTDSMQSLVDGLMNWGGQWDEEEDLAPLPHGMAASMLEERGVLDLQ